MGVFFLNPYCCIKASLSETKPPPLDLETTIYLSYSQFYLQVLIPGFHSMEFWIRVTKNGADFLDKKIGRRPKTPYCKPFSLDLCTHQNGQSQRCASDIISAENSYNKNWFHSPCWLTLIPISQKQLRFLFRELVKSQLIPEIPKDCVSWNMQLGILFFWHIRITEVQSFYYNCFYQLPNIKLSTKFPTIESVNSKSVQRL